LNPQLGFSNAFEDLCPYTYLAFCSVDEAFFTQALSAYLEFKLSSYQAFPSFFSIHQLSSPKYR